VLGIATFILLYNMVASILAGERVGGNPWRALTLEWATTSPPPAYNFVGNPVPFDDPYGYGTAEAQAYVDALDKRFPPPAPQPPGAVVPEPASD
jgi:cytochrome c oxidase subunit I